MRIRRIIIVLLFAINHQAASAYNDHRNTKIDSLEAVLTSGRVLTDKELLSAYDELTRGYLPYNGQKCEEYGRRALALTYKLDNLLIRQYTLRHLGLLRYGREEYDEALSYFQQALAVTDTMATQKRYTQKDLDDARSSLYGTIGNLYNMQDKAHLAIHYYQKALPIFERNGWLESQCVCYYNIGELYRQMENHAESERNYLEAIEKGKTSGDSLLMTLPKKGLADIYFDMGKYGRALQTVDEALAYYQTHRAEEPTDYATTLALKARILLQRGERPHDLIKEALACMPDDIMFDDASSIFLAACEAAMAEGKWKEALAYGLRSVHPDSTATYSDKDGYRLLADIYTELGQKEMARKYMNKAYDIMNRYATDYYQSGLSQMEVLYQTEKKEAQIATLDKERALYRWLLVAAVVAIAALVTGTILIIIVQRRQKALMVAQVALEAETNERRFLARDLHDGLGSILSLIRIKAEKTEVVTLVDKAIVELRRTAHHLMPEELLRNGLVSALNDFAVSVPNTTFSVFGDIQTDRNRELVLYRCAYELVNNAMKHAEATHIGIQLMQDGHELVLTVSDDGKGLKTENDGMGLQNIRERISSYKGVIDIITAESQGTEINIKLPL